MSLLDTVLKIVAALPSDAVTGFGKALAAILRGDSEGAAKHARATAETIAAKQAIRAPYRARAKR
jgi:hypothetical protein